MTPACVSRDDLERLHAGELPAERAAVVEAHLRECPACQRLDAALVAEHEAMLAELRGLGGFGDGQNGDTDATTATPRRDAPQRWPEFPGYEIVGEISRGGQGVVYEAIQAGTNREVAIKVLLDGAYASPTAQRRFEREIELVANLRHPSIVSVFHSGATPDGRAYCVMDFVRGVPINRYVREKGLSLRQTLALFAEVCDGVQYAHHKGVIHRDLKPSNVFVEEPFPAAEADASDAGSRPRGAAAGGDEVRGLGVPKILDFGLAKQLERGAVVTISDSRQVVGTLPYMSPEQARGAADEIDTRTDVYSLGVMLYELLTGRYPYPVDGPLAEVLRHIQETPPTPPSKAWSPDSGVSSRVAGRRMKRRRLPRLHFWSAGSGSPIDEDVRTVLMRALSKERARRYQTALGLGRDVRRYLAGEPIEARRDSLLYIMGKRLRHYRLASGIGAVVLIAGIGVVLLLWSMQHQRAEARRDIKTQLELAVLMFDGPKVEDLLTRAEQLGVDEATVQTNRAFVETLKLNWDRARDAADAAIMAEPNNSVARYLRAVNYALHGRIPEAARDVMAARISATDSNTEVAVDGVIRLLLHQNDEGLRVLGSLRERLQGQAAGVFLPGFGNWFVLLVNPPLAHEKRWEYASTAESRINSAADLYPSKLPFIYDLRADVRFRLALLAGARGETAAVRTWLEQSRQDSQHLIENGAAGAGHLHLSAHALYRGDLDESLRQLDQAFEDLSSHRHSRRFNVEQARLECALLRVWLAYLVRPDDETRAVLAECAECVPAVCKQSGYWMVCGALGGGCESPAKASYEINLGLWAGACLRGDRAAAARAAKDFPSELDMAVRSALLLAPDLREEFEWREALRRFVRGQKTASQLLAEVGDSATRMNWSQLALALNSDDPAARQALLREIATRAQPDIPWTVAQGLLSKGALESAAAPAGAARSDVAAGGGDEQ